MSPDQQQNEGQRSHHVRKKLFSDLLEHVRHWRRITSKRGSQASYSNFNFRLEPIVENRLRLYSLGRTSDSSEHTLLYVDIPLENESEAEYETLIWKPLQDSSSAVSSLFRGVITKEEEILRERMRCLINGIISYDFHPPSCSFLFTASSRLYQCDNYNETQAVIVQEIERASAPMDAKICPVNSRLISYISNNDIYIQFETVSQRATYTQDDSRDRHLTAGVACFVVQEEFDRYTGYWWCPVENEPGKFYILYEEIDETSVMQLSINVPATRSESVELMKYPRTGSMNAKWTLKMLKITLTQSVDIEQIHTLPEINVKELVCVENFRELFPWAEYLVRAEWMPDGSAVWVQLASRVQDRFALVLIPLSSFQDTSRDISMEDLSTIGRSDSQVVVLYEEQSDIWINLHDCLTFVKPTVSDAVRFIWCHAKTGFSHLYLIEACSTKKNDSNAPSSIMSEFDRRMDENLGVPVARPPRIVSEIQLTKGDWEVCKKAEPIVDADRKLIYFLGFKDTPLESHIYCVKLNEPGEILRITQQGYSHGTAREIHPFVLSKDFRMLVTIRSCLNEVGKCVVYSLNYEDGVNSNNFPTTNLIYILTRQDAPLDQDISVSRFSSYRNWDVPLLYTYNSERTGFVHYAYLFKPANCEPGVRYPTILYIYGGPEIQLVRNCWMGHMGLQKYTTLGYAVVLIDGRGSANRGVAFEKCLANNLGTFEIQDQVEVLMHVSDQCNCIDLTRVAIIGWSYGGYMALMGLAQKPELFKVAVSGAPVTHWQLYDTAYTERYMGLPRHPGSEAYSRSSVLTYVNNLPNEAGRLLILHGLIDENVHFQHTAVLINAMVKAGKPYQLQIYPSDRHAVRNSEAAEHLDATVLDFLQNNL